MRAVVMLLAGASVLMTACADQTPKKYDGPEIFLPTESTATSIDRGSVAPGQGSAEASDAPAGPAAQTLPGSPAEALAKWANFPVTASPRPIVLLSDPVQPPTNGFPEGDTKLAFLAGNIVLDAALPANVTQSGDYPIITAATAFTQLKGSGGGTTTTSTTLHVTRVALNQANFNTDRGPRQLPAWAFYFSGSSDPAEVLAVTPSARWAPPTTDPGIPENTSAGFPATLAADGQTLTVSFGGNPIGPPPCGTPADGYVATAQYSATAVLVTTAAVPTPQPSTTNNGVGYACPAIAQQRAVSVRLDAPLGARVLLDGSGQPYEVQ